MQLILLFLLIQWIKCWNVITSKRIVEPINNDSMILNEEYLIQSNGSFSIKYEGIKGYKRLHMIFDAKTNFSQAEILIKVNGIRRSFIVLEENYKEFHVEFEHQASDIKIQFIFGTSTYLQMNVQIIANTVYQDIVSQRYNK